LLQLLVSIHGEELLLLLLLLLLQMMEVDKSL
jgi:hypothetical protein